MSDGKRKWGPGAWILIAGELVIVLMVLMWFLDNRKSDRPDTPPAPVQTGAVDPPAAPGAPPVTAPETEPASVPAPPAFDVVRVEEGGSALVAGRADPGSRVAVLVEGQEAAETEAGPDGAFSLFLDLPASEAAQTLSLSMDTGGGEPVASAGTVILAPVPAAAPAARAETPAADPAQPTDTAPDIAADAPDTAPAPAPAAETMTAALSSAPAVFLAEAGGVRVLQPPQDDAPPPGAGVLIEAISYDAAGGVILAGRGHAGAALRLYLDNAAVGEARVDPAGRWRQALAGIAPGVYALRADLLHPDGTVAARFETPFQREPAEQIAAAAQALQPTKPGGVGAGVITVQPGFTLWGIADRAYGSGFQYVKIFRANADQIRDPDLIYPGQVFELPVGD